MRTQRVKTRAVWGVVALTGLWAPALGLAQQASPKAEPKAAPSKEVEAYLQKATEGVIRHGVKAAKARVPGTIRVATYNIENLFDAEVASDDAGRAPTPRKPDDHRKAISAAIKAIDADVIALQEIGSKEVLTKFRDDYLGGLGYEHVSSIDAGDGRGIEQSVLSRFPIVKEENWPNTKLDSVHPAKLGKRDNPDAGKAIVMARSALHAVVEVPADKTGSGKTYKLHLLVVHHKSGPYHSYQREAEAGKVASIAQELVSAEPSANVLIVGDFNAKAEEKAVEEYFAAGLVDAFAGTDPRDPTYMSHVSGRTIDHILLSAGAAKELHKESRFVLGTMQRKEGIDWRTTPTPAGYASDHYPVVIDLFPVDK